MRTETWHRRGSVYLLGAALVVLAIVIWGQLVSHPVDPAEADGDPDGGALDLVALVIASALALALYAIVVGVVELVLRKRSSQQPDSPE